MREYFQFSTHFGQPPWTVTVFSLLLLLLSIIFTLLFSYRLRRDIRRLREMDPKRDPIQNILRVRDQIFGWGVGLAMFLFVWIGSISRLV